MHFNHYVDMHISGTHKRLQELHPAKRDWISLLGSFHWHTYWDYIRLLQVKYLGSHYSSCGHSLQPALQDSAELIHLQSFVLSYNYTVHNFHIVTNQP